MGEELAWEAKDLSSQSEELSLIWSLVGNFSRILKVVITRRVKYRCVELIACRRDQPGVLWCSSALSYCSPVWRTSGLSAFLGLMVQFASQSSLICTLDFWTLYRKIFSGVHFSRPVFFRGNVSFGKVLTGMYIRYYRKRKNWEEYPSCRKDEFIHLYHRHPSAFLIRLSAMCWGTNMNRESLPLEYSQPVGKIIVMWVEP